MIDRIGNTGVFGYALVCEIDFSVFIQSDVFQKRVSLYRVVNVGFGILIEVDNLCIATAFEIEYAVIVPTVFVVADKKSLGIGGKSRFARSRKTEEYSGVLTVEIGVRRAMHRSDALQRKVIVHHREHTFLHFAAIPGVDDNLFSARNVEHNGSFGVKPEFFVIFDFSLGSVVNNEIGFEVFKFFFRRLNEHVFNKVSLPCNLDDETDCHTGIFVRSAERVYDIKFLAGKLFERDILNRFPRFLRCGMVIVLVFVRSPPDGVFGIIVYDDEFVFRRTTRVNTRHNVDGAEFADLTFFITFERRICFGFEKLFIRRIVNNFLNAGYTVFS